MLHDELISIYKKEYNQTFKNKDEGLRQTYDYKNLKDLDYQTDEKHRDEAINICNNIIGQEFKKEEK